MVVGTPSAPCASRSCSARRRSSTTTGVRHPPPPPPPGGVYFCQKKVLVTLMEDVQKVMGGTTDDVILFLETKYAKMTTQKLTVTKVDKVSGVQEGRLAVLEAAQQG